MLCVFYHNLKKKDLQDLDKPFPLKIDLFILEREREQRKGQRETGREYSSRFILC